MGNKPVYPDMYPGAQYLQHDWVTKAISKGNNYRNFLCCFSEPRRLLQDVNWSVVSPSHCVILQWVSNKPPSHSWGTHLYFHLDDLSRCLDYLVQRRLEITARYDLRCSLLADNVVRSTVQVTADSHSAGLITTICKQGRYTGWIYHFPHSQAVLTD